MTYYYTYKITCLEGTLNGKYYYGQHTSKRKNDNYVGSGTMLLNYFKKYKKIEGETYIKEILAYYNSKEELDNAEIELIGDRYKTDPMCLNLIKGGRQASVDIAKESLSAKKRYEDPEERIKQSERMKKRFEDSEERMKVSIGSKKRYEDPEERRKNRERQKEVAKKPEVHQHRCKAQNKRWKDPEQHKRAKEAAKKRANNTEWVKHQKESQSGSKWVNNGNKEYKAKGEKLQKLLNEGYIYGRLNKNNK